jgi:hypothetical protein
MIVSIKHPLWSYVSGSHAREKRWRVVTSRWQDHDPQHAEPVLYHAEARRKEGFSRRHLHLTAVGERREYPVSLGGVLYRIGQPKTFEAGNIRTAAVRRHDDRLADLQA